MDINDRKKLNRRLNDTLLLATLATQAVVWLMFGNVLALAGVAVAFGIAGFVQVLAFSELNGWLADHWKVFVYALAFIAILVGAMGLFEPDADDALKIAVCRIVMVDFFFFILGRLAGVMVIKWRGVGQPS